MVTVVNDLVNCVENSIINLESLYRHNNYATFRHLEVTKILEKSGLLGSCTFEILHESIPVLLPEKLIRTSLNSFTNVDGFYTFLNLLRLIKEVITLSADRINHLILENERLRDEIEKLKGIQILSMENLSVNDANNNTSNIQNTSNNVNMSSNIQNIEIADNSNKILPKSVIFSGRNYICSKLRNGLYDSNVKDICWYVKDNKTIYELQCDDPDLSMNLNELRYDMVYILKVNEDIEFVKTKYQKVERKNATHTNISMSFEFGTNGLLTSNLICNQSFGYAFTENNKIKLITCDHVPNYANVPNASKLMDRKQLFDDNFDVYLDLAIYEFHDDQLNDDNLNINSIKIDADFKSTENEVKKITGIVDTIDKHYVYQAGEEVYLNGNIHKSFGEIIHNEIICNVTLTKCSFLCGEGDSGGLVFLYKNNTIIPIGILSKFDSIDNATEGVYGYFTPFDYLK